MRTVGAVRMCSEEGGRVKGWWGREEGGRVKGWWGREEGGRVKEEVELHAAR